MAACASSAAPAGFAIPVFVPDAQGLNKEHRPLSTVCKLTRTFTHSALALQLFSSNATNAKRQLPTPEACLIAHEAHTTKRGHDGIAEWPLVSFHMHPDLHILRLLSNQDSSAELYLVTSIAPQKNLRQGHHERKPKLDSGQSYRCSIQSPLGRGPGTQTPRTRAETSQRCPRLEPRASILWINLHPSAAS